MFCYWKKKSHKNIKILYLDLTMCTWTMEIHQKQFPLPARLNKYFPLSQNLYFLFSAPSPPPAHHLRHLLFLYTCIFVDTILKIPCFLSVSLLLMEWVMWWMLPDLQLHYGASVRGMEQSGSEREHRHCDFPKKLLIAPGKITSHKCTLLIYMWELQLIFVFISNSERSLKPKCSLQYIWLLLKATFRDTFPLQITIITVIKTS